MKAEVKAMIARGDQIAGWAHPLYPDGDIRAISLLVALKPRVGVAWCWRRSRRRRGRSRTAMRRWRRSREN